MIYNLPAYQEERMVFRYKGRAYRFVTISILMFSLAIATGTFAEKKEDAAKKKKLYISSIKANGVPKQLADRVKERIRLSIFEDFGSQYQVLDDEAIKVMYKQAESILASGCDDTSCISQIADGINAEEIVYGDVTKDGEKIALSATSLERKGVSLGTKSIVKISFFESQMNHFISETSKKLIIPKYKINMKAEVPVDTSISLKGINLGKIEGLDIAVMKFTSGDEVIGQMLGFLKEIVEKGDKNFTERYYSKSRDEYNNALTRIKAKLMPAQQAKMADFIDGVKKRIGSAYAMEFKKEVESVDAAVSGMDKSGEKNILDIISKYQSIRSKISAIPNEYKPQTAGIKQSTEDRLDSMNIALAGLYEKDGDDAYREYKFETALAQFTRSRGTAGKIINPANRETTTARYDKKIDAVHKTGQSYLENSVKSLIDQASYLNLKDETDKSNIMLGKARDLIKASQFITEDVVNLYNDMADVLKSEKLYFNKNTNRLGEDPGKIQRNEQAVREKERKSEERNRSLKKFWSKDVNLQLAANAIVGGTAGAKLGNVVKSYSEAFINSLQQSTYKYNFDVIDDKAKNKFSIYGVNLEPRILIWHFGLGMSFLFEWSNTSKSSVQQGYDSATNIQYKASLAEKNYIPTFFIRPLYGKTGDDINYNLLIGAGYVLANSSAKFSTKYTETSYVQNKGWVFSGYPDVNKTFNGNGTGYRFLAELSLIFKEHILVNVGFMYGQWKIDSYKSSDGEKLKDASGNTFKSDSKTYCFYMGTGLSI